MLSEIRKFSNYQNLRIGITGSPGTGKKTLGAILAKKLELGLISINQFAISNRFAKRNGNEYEINVGRLRGRIDTQGKIVTGHLLPYVVPNDALDLVILLRCSPNTLRERYERRRYSREKIRENLEAELIGLIAAECGARYDIKKIAEFDTSKTKPETLARRVLDIIIGRRPPSFGTIDWISGLSSSGLEHLLTGKCNRFNIPKRITRFANPKARKSRYSSEKER